MNKTLISTLMICGAGFAFSDSVVTFGEYYYDITSDSYSKFHNEMLVGELSKDLEVLNDQMVTLTVDLLKRDTLTDKEKSEYANKIIGIMKQTPLPILSKLAGIPQSIPLHISEDNKIDLVPVLDKDGVYTGVYTIEGFDQLTRMDKDGYSAFAAEKAKVQTDKFEQSLSPTLDIINALQSVEFKIFETPLDSYGIEVGVSSNTSCYDLIVDEIPMGGFE